MRAVVVRHPGSKDPVEVADLPDPGHPRPGEVRVRIHASALNYHDNIVMADPTTAVGHIPLADGAGVVEAVGEGVTELTPGDSVVARFFPTWHAGNPVIDHFGTTPGIGLPGYAREIVVAPAAQFARAPRGYSHAESATLTVAGLTAWSALMGDSGIKPGDTVVLLGTGGVSMYALQFAKLAGATTIVTSSSDFKLERATALGADYVVNYRTVPDWGDHIHKWTGGGADLVLEVGGPSTLPQSIQAVRIGGQISMIGVLTGVSGEVPTGDIDMKQLTLRGVLVGNHEQQREMTRAIEASDIRPIIDRTFPLEELSEALRYFTSGTHLGKVIIEV
ncbi:NAD(P)-dependent alcohol dehydrogenase [Streptomyces sp. NBC_00365]|uniref:zinc-dependent alcohol dehydrogenase family protein n=1 Tax=Streptomyces sp. NBC_00365 TaxID=2975726 RepID=UPI00224E6D1A|nr:NAD(P)-dependent alcohol dehydrogenase [Streptomyces sp. NBC_00365]MCX5096844.1 NAD(P)-dependent alcohol dehydrogenase [Streptomyces sp. NBC_00365]